MKQLNWFFAVSALILAGCSTGNSNIDKIVRGKGIPVKVSEIGKSINATDHMYIGTIEESFSVPLSFLVTGTAEKVLVDEGQMVKKGQLLAILNNESYQNMYQVALSKAKQAEDAYNRLEPMYKKGSLPEIKYVEIKTGLDQAHSLASISEKNLNDCNLYAPADGIVGRRMIEPGMSIIPGKPVFQLVKIDKVNVKIPVPENEIAGIQKGQEAYVKVSALGDRKFEGEVTEIGVLSNPLSHTYNIKVALNNPDKILKPGMVCKVSINNPVMGNRIVVPLSVIQVGGDKSKYVYVANSSKDKVVKRNVELGSLASNGVVITSGLSAGDLLITEGYQKINESTTIQIVR
ncbi:efflux RND transporter periplasmic adaptor subunit [Maribellus comscasis]|jgi:RND family efflux transporter MFP subunit|uniref:Efflux RND transporter periplasmic adaptor subunit n=1 Tax=Maribellus comscasis TaxID=2681766 RepID=A0A6I6K010_9BACT|nr:efflux RND transporter periplasmic adaptor subunit [Maribellus comscasis]QGY45867.1 efflux RND transporter periplasmic adaptor subunit [Maribellus comscasis]HCE57025.1 efflux RND transporter periplasmic adaptor subunit [Prolixibacteraceae bacterium]